jgi:hypothetical protein
VQVASLDGPVISAIRDSLEIRAVWLIVVGTWLDGFCPVAASTKSSEFVRVFLVSEEIVAGVVPVIPLLNWSSVQLFFWTFRWHLSSRDNVVNPQLTVIKR